MFTIGTLSRRLVSRVKSHFAVYDASVGTFSGHTDTVHEVHFSPNNPNQVFSCSNDGTVRVWDFRTGQMTHRLHGGGELNSAALNCTGTVLAAGAESGQVLLWFAPS